MANGDARVAIKIFDKDAFQQNVVMEAFARECASLQKLASHDNIVGLIDIGRDGDSGCSYVALEWCDANLLDYLKSHPEPTWAGFSERYGRDILGALCRSEERRVGTECVRTCRRRGCPGHYK